MDGVCHIMAGGSKIIDPIFIILPSFLILALCLTFISFYPLILFFMYYVNININFIIFFTYTLYFHFFIL